MLTHLHHAWVKLQEAYSVSCGRSWTDEAPQEQSDEEAQRQPQEEFAYEKAGNWAFHNSSAESEEPETEINSLVNIAFFHKTSA